MGPVDLVQFLKKKRDFRDTPVATCLDVKKSNSSQVPAFGSDIVEEDISSSNAVNLIESLLGVESPTPIPTSTNVISESENSSDDTLSSDDTIRSGDASSITLPAEKKKRLLDTKSTGLSHMKKKSKKLFTEFHIMICYHINEL